MSPSPFIFRFRNASLRVFHQINLGYTYVCIPMTTLAVFFAIHTTFAYRLGNYISDKYFTVNINMAGNSITLNAKVYGLSNPHFSSHTALGPPRSLPISPRVHLVRFYCTPEPEILCIQVAEVVSSTYLNAKIKPRSSWQFDITLLRIHHLTITT